MTNGVSNPRSYLAAWFPFLSTERLVRVGVAPPDVPVVTVERSGNAVRLAHIGRDALTLGLTPGLTLADARARVPGLEAHEVEPGADRALLEWLADACDRYTPSVALDGADALVLDLTGCAPTSEVEEDLTRELERLGLSVRIAHGITPPMALARARFAIMAVASLPVQALGLDSETHVALARAGLKTVGEAAARPRAPLVARFGAGLVRRLLELTGEDDPKIVPRRVPPPVFALRRFAEPVAHVEAVLATLRELMADACGQLERRGEGARALAASLYRSDGQVRRLMVETGRPVRDAKAIAKLFDERIGTLADPLDPGFGFDCVRLDVQVAEPLAAASPRLDGEREGGEAVAALVDRLSTRLGRGRVVRLAPVDTHIPEQAQLELPAVDARPVAAWPKPEPGEPPLRPLHLFDPPQPVEVMAEVPDGPPMQFRWRRKLHPVARVEGPERIASEWWVRDEGHEPGKGGLTRDYYRVEDVRGRRYWLFRHGLYGMEKANPKWFVHGVFA